MGSFTVKLILSFLLCSSLACIASTSRAINPAFPPSSRFPQGQAERLIKALNLLPGAAGDSDDDSDDVHDGPRLQERKLNLTIQGGAGINTETLGQYAEYFKLARTHAANMFYFFFESRGNKTDDPVVLWL